MVKKCSKAGLHTGNTIRLPGGHPFLQKYQKYSYVIADSKCMTRGDYKNMDEIMKILPSPDGNLQYSMNKKKRWELPRVVKSKLIQESDNPNFQMTVTEHTLHVGEAQDDHNRFCTAYYSSAGPVLEKKSQSEMNMKSAQQGYTEMDHLNKLERRQLKKDLGDLHLKEMVDAVETPSYSCHIVHGAPTNGRLYKDLTTKGVLIARSSKRNNMTYTHSKLHRNLVDDDDYNGRDIAEDDYDDIPADDFVSERPMTIPLKDLIISHDRTKKQQRYARKKDFVVI